MSVALRDSTVEPVERPRLRVVPPVRPATHRVYRARRLLVIIVLATTAAAVGLGVVATRPAASVTSTMDSTVGVTVVIGPGETLWDVAVDYLPDGRDRMSWIADVAAANDADPGTLRPGTAVVIPVQAAAVTARP